MDSTPAYAATVAPNKVVPLLSAVARVEELASSLAIRLDPIVDHAGAQSGSLPSPSTTVTSRLHSVGDALQYLLDNIEL